jgi:hypothetical protein
LEEGLCAVAGRGEDAGVRAEFVVAAKKQIPHPAKTAGSE